MSFLTRIKDTFFRPKTPTADVLPLPGTMVTPGLFAEVRRLKAQADWMGELLEDDLTGEIGFTNGLDGTDFWGSQSQVGGAGGLFGYRTAYSQCLFRPSYGAAFYINEAMHRIIRARSRAFCSINPYFHGVLHNLQTHVIGKGHNWTAVWRKASEKGSDRMLLRVQADLDEFYQAGYRTIQKEKVERKSRDGEYFLRFYEEGDRLRVRFVEPLLVWSPPGKTEVNDCLFGIQYRKGNYERPLGYYIRRTNYQGAEYGYMQDAWERMIPTEEMQHGKANVDLGTPRGIPDTYWVQNRLEQSLKTLRSAGVLVEIRSKVAMIRKRVNAFAGALNPLLSANGAVAVSGAGQGSNLQSVLKWPDGAVFDVSDQADYQMPSQNLEIKETVAAISAELQSAASSLGLADYMVSGSLGGGSYSSSMIAEGPVVKTFEDDQADCIDEDRVAVNKVIDTGIVHGRYGEDARELIKVEMSGPPLARISVQEAQTMSIENQAGVLSKKTWRQHRGYDNETETANIAEEQAQDDKHELEMQRKMIEINPPAGNGATNGKSKGTNGKQPTSMTNPQARNRMNPTQRPMRPDDEGRQIQRSSGATVEELLDTSIAVNGTAGHNGGDDNLLIQGA